MPAASFSVLSASRDSAAWESGAAGNVEVVVNGRQSAQVDGLACTEQRTIDVRRNEGKTQRGSEPIGRGSNVTENPPAAFAKQKTYSHKNRLSRTIPLPSRFGPLARDFVRAGAQTAKRWPEIICAGIHTERQVESG